MTLPATIAWDAETCSIRFIDQTKLPGRLVVATCTTVPRLAVAIRRLGIRGAPALGVAGAFGIALAAQKCRKTGRTEFLDTLERAGRDLAGTRPTAVNLSWGIERTLAAARRAATVPGMQEAALSEALAIAREDEACCHAIGNHGAALIPDGGTVLTHCNAGALACSAWGTALGIIRSAVSKGKQVRVIASETRPLLQGARLTAWELLEDGIGVTVITDSMAASMMHAGTIDCVIVGADRITPDAVFNKIGTYMHAVCARHHSVPLYVAAPLSTFDLINTASEITIEERGRGEVATCGRQKTVPDKAAVYNPSFDATPLDLVGAIVTEHGVLRPPFDLKLQTSRWRERR
ncbi:MAG TPA: S-methyl-5-thioribose-1-phosphate isomerase [Methanoregulaceae archaeon]|nr:S-methyl-5-thioribose-1-phosphate isomerase [Methanoregulaceae archaeon]HRY75220.1 S-methyl-5-thioribose-1-phosphate isomerase [Methanoregulaceae archaeon]